jgi:hypothetical protein
MRRSAIVLAILAAAPVAANDAVSIKLTPTVAKQAPAAMVVSTRIAAHEDNRALIVSAESPYYFLSSEVPLDGHRAPRARDFLFRNLPPGEYEVTMKLIGSRGPRAAASRLFIVAGHPN